MADTGVIKEGDQIIIKTNNVLKVFQIRKTRQIRVEKVRFVLDGALGHHYGTTFEVKGGKLIKVESDSPSELETLPDAESNKDNRNLTDTAHNQKLNKEDIHALRKEGVTGKDIVGQLIENSATFKNKTVFSQEKYIKKKHKKHLTEFTILKPNTRLLSQMYFSKGPTKICNLRQDSIAQILTYGNVRAGCKLMVVESVIGLLVGAILERLSSYGTVVQFYTGSAPSRQAMEAYDFSTAVKKTLLSFPLNRVRELKREKCNCPAASKTRHLSESPGDKDCDTDANGETGLSDKLKRHKGEGDTAANSGDITQTGGSTESGDVTGVVCEAMEVGEVEAAGMDEEAGHSESGSDEDSGHDDVAVATGEEAVKRKSDWDEVKARRRQYRLEENRKSQVLLESGEMDGLIVVTKFHPTPIVMSLIDFVAPSRPIVIFSQYKEPLLDCYVKLRNRGGVLSLRLTETWLRKYQVLSNRTHPYPNMSGTGGYLLTGTTVLLDQ